MGIPIGPGIDEPLEPQPTRTFMWRFQYDSARDQDERAATDIDCQDPSLTVQSFQEDVDINVMMKRFGVTDGAVPPAAVDPRYFGDFEDGLSFRQALDRIREAQEHFALLPADLRNRFANDPLELYNFVQNPDNAAKAVELGLLKKQVPETQALTPPSGANPDATASVT